MLLPTAFSRRARKTFLFLHLWLGLILGLWFVAVSVTGGVLAWLPQLLSTEIQIRYPQDRIANNGRFVPVSTAIEAMRQAQPDMTPQELSSIGLPNHRYPYYMFFRHDKPFKNAMFLVDPYSARVNAPRIGTDSYMFKIATFHRELLFDAKGLIANGVASAFAVVMLLSGLWLWWPSTYKQLKERISIKRGASPRRFLRDLHNVMSIYFFIVVFGVTLTSALMVYNDSTNNGLQKALDAGAATHPAHPMAVKPGGPMLSDDDLVAHAQAVAPGALLIRIKRPLKPSEPFCASLLYPNSLYPDVDVTLDAHTGNILTEERDSSGSRGRKAVAMINELHYGTFGGIWTQLIYTVAGILPLGLFITGVWMWWSRKSAERRSKQRRAQAAPQRSLVGQA